MQTSDHIDPGFMPNLSEYDFIAVSSSAGKDSQAMLDYVYGLAKDDEIIDRVVVIHSDLGRVEWAGTAELAREQTEHYGLRFIITSRIGGVAKKDSSVYKKGESYGDIIDYAERRGSWPSSTARWCTSEFKRGPINKVYTMLAKEWREANPDMKRPCRILDCQGLRSEESPARAKKAQFKVRKASTTQAIDTWLPIQFWLEGDVWLRTDGCGTVGGYRAVAFRACRSWKERERSDEEGCG